MKVLDHRAMACAFALLVAFSVATSQAAPMGRRTQQQGFEHRKYAPIPAQISAKPSQAASCDVRALQRSPMLKLINEVRRQRLAMPDTAVAAASPCSCVRDIKIQRAAASDAASCSRFAVLAKSKTLLLLVAVCACILWCPPSVKQSLILMFSKQCKGTPGHN